jgi:hypothetical protein
MSLVDTCLLIRRHELNTGDNWERGNLVRDAKGNDKRPTPQAERRVVFRIKLMRFFQFNLRRNQVDLPVYN